MKREELVKAIRGVLPGIDDKAVIGDSDLVSFEKGWVRGFNDKMSIAYPLDTKINCSVPGKIFFDMLNKMKSSEIRLSVKDNKLILNTTNSQLELKTVDRDLDKIEDLDFKPLPENFMEALRFCSLSAAKDPAMGSLCGICFSGNEAISSDNFRIGCYQMKQSCPYFVLPFEASVELLKLKEKLIEVFVGESWVYFKGESGAIMSSRVISEEYRFDLIKGILSSLEKGKSFDLPSGLDVAVERAKIMAWDDDLQLGFIVFKKEGENLIMEGERDVGRYSEKIPWNADFPEGLSLSVEADFLKKILSTTKNFIAIDEGKKILFEGENFSHLMLTRMEY